MKAAEYSGSPPRVKGEFPRSGRIARWLRPMPPAAVAYVDRTAHEAWGFAELRASDHVFLRESFPHRGQTFN